MKFIVFVMAVLAVATYAKASVIRTDLDHHNHEPAVDHEHAGHHEHAGPSTPRTEVAGASTPLTILPQGVLISSPDVFKAAHESHITHLEDVDAAGGVPADPKKEIIRHRRLTCDVFSFSSSAVTPNHAACATKCIAMGRKGGHCDGTTCNCRGDKWIG